MSKKQPKKGQAKPSSGWKFSGWTAFGAIVAIGLAVGLASMVYQGQPVTDGPSFHVKGGETKPVLDPYSFASSRQFSAYSMAKRYPEVMDEMYCYCNCDRPPFLHKSLLSCFTDNHGAG